MKNIERSCVRISVLRYLSQRFVRTSLQFCAFAVWALGLQGATAALASALEPADENHAQVQDRVADNDVPATKRLDEVVEVRPKLSGSKSQYTLFNPTPKTRMREMITDRPDTTESPNSVDAGHYQFEISVADWSYDHGSGANERGISIFPTNLKIGLANDIDIQFVFTPFERVDQSQKGGERSHDQGFSDSTQVRLKVNMWGNDEGDTALAVMPYVKAPTGSGDLSNDHVEGGLIVPFGAQLPDDFYLGLMAQLDYVHGDDESYSVEFLHTGTIGHEIWGPISGYVEYIGLETGDLHGQYRGRASGGLTYGVSDDLILDAGGTFGLSRNTDNLTLFVGLSFRI